jgi:hypothetical protein
MGSRRGTETFGFIDFGLRAIGLHLHAHDRFRAFLTSHAWHQIYQWAYETKWDLLPSEMQERIDPKGVQEDPTTFIEYEEPSSKEGYIKARLVFECSKCDDTCEGEGCNNRVNLSRRGS